MTDRERRGNPAKNNAAALRAGLMPEQLATLKTMEQFGWTLRFVRRPMFLTPVAVMFAADGQRFAVLEADGSFNENPDFKWRP